MRFYQVLFVLTFCILLNPLNCKKKKKTIKPQPQFIVKEGVKIFCVKMTKIHRKRFKMDERACILRNSHGLIPHKGKKVKFYETWAIWKNGVVTQFTWQDGVTRKRARYRSMKLKFLKALINLMFEDDKYLKIQKATISNDLSQET